MKGCLNIGRCLNKVQRSESQTFLYFCLYSKAQLKELAYSPRNYKRTIPILYTWPAGDQEVIQSNEDDMPFSQLRAGESLLEIHLKVQKHSNVLPEFVDISHEAEICFVFVPSGRHLHPSRASFYGLRPSRRGWR